MSFPKTRIMTYNIIKSQEEFDNAIAQNTAVLVYFSHEKCNVCEVLKPKISEMIQQEYPKIGLFSVDTENQPSIAAQQRIFTVPTVLIFFDGRESVRKSRNIGVEEFRNELLRPYSMIFS